MSATESLPVQRSSRFESVQPAPPDAILGLTEAFKADPRKDKLNLTVGVYQDETGTTPILDCVKEAEKRLVESETTKGYLGIDGLPEYQTAVRELVFGDQINADRIATLQTPGGTGAVRVAAEFLASQCGLIAGEARTRIFLPSPTWANHNAIFASAGLPIETYRYLGSDRRTLDFDGLIEDVTSKTRPGDAILLHACCHNPTGVDPTTEQWRTLANALKDRGVLPVIDFAYQGFGEGLEQDATGMNVILSQCDEALVCSSYSKNFGLYSERIGAISLVGGNAEATTACQTQLKRLVRSNYSNPPRHGAAIVATILNDGELKSQWKAELTAMRTRIHALRDSFVSGMQVVAPEHDFGFLLQQKGMFSFSGLNQMQVDQLRSEHGVFIVGSGRINVAGMKEDRMEWLCQAIASVL
ncbi:MAG: amino acid aminotransferase [Planctomycetota bacterium]